MEQAEAREPLEVSAEEFKIWVEHKITKQVMGDIIDIREHLKNYLASGGTVAKDADISTDRIVGRIEGLTELFNLFTEKNEELKEKIKYDH